MANRKFRKRKFANKPTNHESTDNKRLANSSTSHETSLKAPEDKGTTNVSPQLRSDFKRYSEALLYLLTPDKEEIIKDIAKKRDVNFLKSIFSRDSFETFLEDSKEEISNKHEECVYKLFLFFSEPRFAEESYSMKVFNWLADEIKIEEIIEKKDKIKMIHWLASSNNLWGVEWAFKRYRKQLKANEIENIFQISDENGQDLFCYLIDGIISGENLNSSPPQTEIIKVVLKEFGWTISNKKREEEEVNRKKELMKSLLEGIEFTGELEEQLAQELQI